MIFDVSQISQIPASDAKRNILRALTVFEKKTGIDLKGRRWYVVASMSSEYSKSFPESLAEVVSVCDCSLPRSGWCVMGAVLCGRGYE